MGEDIKDLNTRVDELERRMAKSDEDHKEFYNRIRNLESKQGVINAHYEHMETALTELKVDITDIKTSLCEIKEKPAERWDTVITAAIGVLVGLLLNGMFPM